MSPYSNSSASSSKGTFRQAFILAVICLALGVILGVFVRRSQVAVSTPVAAGNARLSTDSMAGARQVTPDQLKRMADMQAQPLLAQLRSTPNDPELLSKLGHIYYVTQDFKEASTYFKRSVDIRDDAIVRTQLGLAYYYSGDPDHALAEFDRVLKSDPDNANAMFNVGMIKWQSKSDADGAVAVWQQILKKYPNHPRRAEVEQLIARAKQQRAVKQ
jgi:cytochrome c-type biogenesis protein CcmH/NrfG